MTASDQPKHPRDELIDHLPAMRAFAVTLTRDTTLADDMVQDAVEKAWSNLDKFQGGTNMRAWLFTILRNTYYSNRRKAKREVADSDGTALDSVSQKPDHDGRLNLMDFELAFRLLPEEQREALILVGASGFGYEEAAEMCNVAVGTIKSRVNRGRSKLADLMGLSPDDSIELTDSATLAVVSSRHNGRL